MSKITGRRTRTFSSGRSHRKYSGLRKNVPVATANASEVTAKNGPAMRSAGMPSSTETPAPTRPPTRIVTKSSLPFWLIEPATAELNDTIASWPSEICPAKPVMMSSDRKMMATITPPVNRLTRLAFHPSGRNRSSGAADRRRAPGRRS